MKAKGIKLKNGDGESGESRIARRVANRVKPVKRVKTLDEHGGLRASLIFWHLIFGQPKVKP